MIPILIAIWALLGAVFFIGVSSMVKKQPQKIVFYTLCGPLVWIGVLLAPVLVECLIKFFDWLTEK
jgi:hypothetical protein